jgi:P27 family predicted phage terminase small subunit
MAKKVVNSSICSEAQTFLDNLTALLKKQNILTSLDEDTLVLIGNTYHNYIQATQVLLREGLLNSDETKAHPCIKIQLDAQIQLNKMMFEYGMSPKARKEIIKPAERSKEESDIAKFIKKQKRVNVEVQHN